jgi:predicted aldo/keto reductase-like oxidoreductase
MAVIVKFPDARKDIFLVTKTGARNPDEITRQLNLSLERMKTDYIDLYFIHGISSINEMTPEVKAWAENAKKSKKIKFMGFSTHSNMANCLAGAAKLGWIDGIMMTYNYRLMHEENMKSAVDACQKAGIGLTAMKTQGGGPVKTDSEGELKFAGRFVQKGFTPEQAKLKAVWDNSAIGSICSQMHSLTLLMANAAAAADKTKLSYNDRQIFKQYAQNTCSGYCAGCSDICDSAMNRETRIADIMRYMMYYRNYGDLARAKEEFAKLPLNIRLNLARINYSPAEYACPHKLPIGQIIKEASDYLA